MKWLKRSVGALLALVALLAVVPLFITLNDYVPELEKELSARVGEPVSIDNVRASLLPTPHARIDGIEIGKSGEVRVDRS